MSTPKARQVPSRLRQLGLGVLLLCALALAVAGLRLMIAGIAAYQAQRFVEDWERLGTVPSQQAWDIAEAAAQRSLSFYPGANGDYYERLGQIYEWQHHELNFGDAVAEPSRQRARDAYRLAIETRPNWPDTWVLLAFVKLRLLEFDEEFDRALAHGFENGPWRMGINRGLAKVGLIAWPQLDETQRRQILESAQRTVEFSQAQALGLFGVADRIDQTELLCDSLPETLTLGRGVCVAASVTQGPPWPGDHWIGLLPKG
ncbi:hypothetical protein [Marinobacterium sedimentorum]|uniref:hypothetical protein n=1 Tax=Marinobacterium sedimentorum TaxID=2927804 RepID=UPI0020C681F7|nr:hypothetical protein [Marinobacterium sedimentorum]MCP8690031.1 hypothetical protein [Marinobacterium sedimentorum]